MKSAAETPEQSLARQTAVAWQSGLEFFVDEDTKTLISLDPLTGTPGAFGVWVRALRLQRREIERRWLHRARRAIARLLHVRRFPEDK